ncbi:HflK protein [Tepidicaulis marinus]|uniref:Protein HflK n=1 Tax=Tepidicaulis marinus TaxID=1333998 RepID=A0A081B9X2_9HYPH|nr:FtsH protease activity modulator HflK [Tepidicaulis marinus]GAK44840.1 HflK protein [Tepidicaulis marinus]
MPWNNQSGGGGWQNGGNRGPWGQPPSGGGRGGQEPPDLEDLIRKGQERLRGILPSGGGSSGGFIVVGLILLGLLGWSSFYRVDTDQQGVVLRFGEAVRTAGPGLHFKLPYPIETVYSPSVTKVNRVNIGENSIDESLMLTGDENIVDVDFVVLWRIADAQDYLFNVEGKDTVVKAVAESAMREIVGSSGLQVLLTTQRNEVQLKVQELVQNTLNDYGAGIEVLEVQLQSVDPPKPVEDAFRDVQAARADQERLRNEAEAYANTVVPRARGEADQILQAAEAYKEQTVAQAQGQADRFLAIYNEYKSAKDITRKRIYLETMEGVLSGMNKIVVDPKAGGSGPVPYLPLNQLAPGASQKKEAQ